MILAPPARPLKRNRADDADGAVGGDDSGAASSVIEPRQPKEMPRDALMLEVGTPLRYQTQCYCVVISEDAMAALESAPDTQKHLNEQWQSFPLLPGRYWRLPSTTWHGASIYRQELSDGVNCEGLFLWFETSESTPNGEGWYIGREPKVPKGGSDDWPLAFIYDDEENGPDCHQPKSSLHVPMNNKKPTMGIKLQSYEEWAEEQFIILQVEVENQRQHISVLEGRLDAQVDPSTAASLQLGSTGHGRGSKGSKGKGKGKGKGKCSSNRYEGGKGHGGWMVRSFAMIRAFNESAWGYLKERVAEYENRYDMVDMLWQYRAWLSFV